MSHKSLSNRQNLNRILIEGRACVMKEKIRKLLSNLRNTDDLNGLDNPGEMDQYLDTILAAVGDMNHKLDAILSVEVRKPLTTDWEMVEYQYAKQY